MPTERLAPGLFMAVRKHGGFMVIQCDSYNERCYLILVPWDVIGFNAEFMDLLVIYWDSMAMDLCL